MCSMTITNWPQRTLEADCPGRERKGKKHLVFFEIVFNVHFECEGIASCGFQVFCPYAMHSLQMCRYFLACEDTMEWGGRRPDTRNNVGVSTEICLIWKHRCTKYRGSLCGGVAHMS